MRPPPDPHLVQHHADEVALLCSELITCGQLSRQSGQQGVLSSSAGTYSTSDGDGVAAQRAVGWRGLTRSAIMGQQQAA